MYIEQTFSPVNWAFVILVSRCQVQNSRGWMEGFPSLPCNLQGVYREAPYPHRVCITLEVWEALKIFSFPLKITVVL